MISALPEIIIINPMINLNPLEQFSINSINSIILNKTNLTMITTITNTVILLLIGLFVLITFQITTSSHSIKPTKWNIIIETLIASVLGIIKDQLITKTNLIYFPLILTFFNFVFISNILGMIPYSFTPTSHISITLGLSITIMIGITLIGFEKHQLDFFSLFIPKGTPLPLIPLLILIEFISYSAKAFSLALRLTANVSAGHCLFGVISSLSLSSIITITNLILKGITISLPLLILIPLYGLELLVALLQSYVFTLLTCSYLADIININNH